MKLKHTQGETEIVKNNAVSDSSCIMIGKKLIAQFPEARGDNFERIPVEEATANMMLLSAADLALKTAINTYVSLLNLEPYTWRIQNQAVYCGLRDYISIATGYSPMEVQDFFEQVRLLVKYEKMTIEQAINASYK